MRAVDLIARKRDGGALSTEDYAWLVRGHLAGEVDDAQVAALLMAGVLNGFDDDEASSLTTVLLHSGDRLDLSGLAGPTVDKHSTGGVGDGTTLLVAPLLAAAGVQVVKLSGRGLGHTGGTLDKLEAVPGLRTDLEVGELLGIAERVGCVVAAQSDALVPADRALYALRDVTGTVASPALIASSVMSKKLAAGAGTIVLDVKVGDGAFMRHTSEAEALAALCVRLGREAGRRCRALVSAMDQPLGSGIGNALEVVEAVRLLQDARQPWQPTRLAALSLTLAAHALALARSEDGGAGDGTVEDAREELAGHWSDGGALERLRAMIAAQGGDAAVCDDPGAVLPSAPVRRLVPAGRGGVVRAVPARPVGELAASLGAGRARKGDPVDPAVGLELAVAVGQAVQPGQPLGVVHARDVAAADRAATQLVRLVDIVDGEPDGRPRGDVVRVVTGEEAGVGPPPRR